MKNQTAPINNNTDFIEQTEYYMKMLTGALAVLSSTDPAELSKDDFHDYCFGLIQINERFTGELIDYMRQHQACTGA